MSNTRAARFPTSVSEIEERVRLLRASMAAPIVVDERTRAIMKKWEHKNEGTPQTHEHAQTINQGHLSRLYMAGKLSADQFAWAIEIGEIFDLIAADVSVSIVKYEPRIDCESSGRDILVEGILRVRREVAYTWWRKTIPAPSGLILDILTGERCSLSRSSMLHGMHRRRGLRNLLAALDLWPDAVDYAEQKIDAAELAAAHAGLI